MFIESKDEKLVIFLGLAKLLNKPQASGVYLSSHQVMMAENMYKKLLDSFPTETYNKHASPDDKEGMVMNILEEYEDVRHPFDYESSSYDDYDYSDSY